MIADGSTLTTTCSGGIFKVKKLAVSLFSVLSVSFDVTSFNALIFCFILSFISFIASGDVPSSIFSIVVEFFSDLFSVSNVAVFVEASLIFRLSSSHSF